MKSHDQPGWARALWCDMTSTVIDAAQTQGVSKRSELTPCHHTRVTVVRVYEREVIGSQAKKSFFSALVDMDATTDSPLTRLTMAPAATKVGCFKSTAWQN